MESGSILQFLIIAGVVIYGVWSASKKSASQKREQENSAETDDNLPQNESDWDEYFPTYTEMSAHTDSGDIDRKVIINNRDRKGRNTELKNTDNYHLATSSIKMTDESSDNVDNQSKEDGKSVPGNKDITDLRTIIISSELLKPKYLEY